MQKTWACSAFKFSLSLEVEGWGEGEILRIRSFLIAEIYP